MGGAGSVAGASWVVGGLVLWCGSRASLSFAFESDGWSAFELGVTDAEAEAESLARGAAVSSIRLMRHPISPVVSQTPSPRMVSAVRYGEFCVQPFVVSIYIETRSLVHGNRDQG